MGLTTGLGRSVRQLSRRLVKAVGLTRDPLYRQALWHGVAASIEHASVPFPRSYETVIDVGASIGQFTLFALRTFPLAQVHALEPLPSSYERAQSVLAPHPRVELIAVAASSRAGPSSLNVTSDRHSSSLRHPTDQQTTQFPGTEAIGVQAVETQTLDALSEAWELRPPILLKIDTQGSELEVLRGAERLLNCVSEVFVECSFIELYEGQARAHEVIALLSSAGFRLVGVYSPQYAADGRAVQLDALFSRSE